MLFWLFSKKEGLFYLIPNLNSIRHFFIMTRLPMCQMYWMTPCHRNKSDKTGFFFIFVLSSQAPNSLNWLNFQALSGIPQHSFNTLLETRPLVFISAVCVEILATSPGPMLGTMSRANTSRTLFFIPAPAVARLVTLTKHCSNINQCFIKINRNKSLLNDNFLYRPCQYNQVSWQWYTMFFP